MGIVNVTPDSFSDGGRHLDARHAIAHALALHAQGADVVDVGGESTRPGADDVPVDEELRRVLPVIDALVAAGVPVSIDTMKPAVMRAAIDAGVAMVNDVQGFRQPGAIEAVADADVMLCAMHMQGAPRDMQHAPRYDDVVAEVDAFLEARATALEAAGVARDRIVIDPGFGFGKTAEHNLRLLRDLGVVVARGRPVLVGLSRKSMLGAITGRGPDARVHGSVAAALAAVARGARWVRVHDVAATVDALKVWAAADRGALAA
ncbi:MAG: dihydropteroate synthase [Burkholderiales bacterium]|nr:dihydropteroate synthase [Burkholderiales bacterium]